MNKKRSGGRNKGSIHGDGENTVTEIDAGKCKAVKSWQEGESQKDEQVRDAGSCGISDG